MMPSEELTPGASLPPSTVPMLAAALASRIRPILPEEFSCIADDTRVILVRDHAGVRSLDLADAPEWRAESWVEDLRAVVWQVLSDFQDEIVEQVWQAWPPAPGGGTAIPYVEIKDGRLLAGFRHEGQMFVGLDPMNLDDVETQGRTG